MRVWTAHEKPGAPAILLREGFSFGAAALPPLWLAMRHAWIPAAMALLVLVLIHALTPAWTGAILDLGFAMLMGYAGRDLVRWSAARQGFLLTNVVTGRNEDEARARLLAHRPDLVTHEMMVETAP